MFVLRFESAGSKVSNVLFGQCRNARNLIETWLITFRHVLRVETWESAARVQMVTLDSAILHEESERLPDLVILDFAILAFNAKETCAFLVRLNFSYLNQAGLVKRIMGRKWYIWIGSVCTSIVNEESKNEGDGNCNFYPYAVILPNVLKACIER